MKFAILISMYDEHKTALKSIYEIKTTLDADIYLIHSFNKETQDLFFIKNLVTKYVSLENLGPKITDSQKLAANCLCRNFSTGFSEIYNSNINYDCIVVMLADTLTYDAKNFERCYSDMQLMNYKLYVSQAIGNLFFGPNHDKDPDRNKGDRLQHPMITDFMPQLFIIDGKFAQSTKCFSNIKITNEYCSENCLGDEAMNYFKDAAEFHKYVGKLGLRTFNYNDGVQFNVK